ncbi:polyphosphate kinase [Eubacterium ruminantium]|uniref:Polyphosphate kinase n=1 Tax=Eubacterium ruminantium TaxID=42322 RepID=A0A1T4LBQ7_9FIRM|nr:MULTISPECIES: polyphosphate kinase 1 [Eubacterium]MCR5368274.1 polyphosphate kinase 1 [Eubacterium sp.]SCW44814.1 polyphosphate kinase [Eubacterium ruminantium]SDM75549.1 polyphosphate kinase [Eubacterium ruminantium]SJZ52063.1 polyphosphate kinase [Eubacterium ruminantium]
MKDVYENRELSWLKFNERVLEEAEDVRIPLCERLSFISIFQTNLDEFFMVRVGSLHDQMLLEDNPRENKTNMTAEEQIDAIADRVKVLSARHSLAYRELMEEFEKHGIKIINFAKLDEKEGEYLKSYFDREILPLLSPMTVTKKQPFPFIKNNEIYAVSVLANKNNKERLGIIPCNDGMFRRLIQIPGSKGYYMLAEELILHFLPDVFSGYTVVSKSLVRVTRNADIDADKVYDEELNYRDHMAEVIKQRRKLCPVRMEYTRDMDKTVLSRIRDHLNISENMLFKKGAPLDMSFVFDIQDILRHKPELFFEKRIPQKSPQFDETKPLIPQIIESDKLLSYPFESIRPFLNMLVEAANDPDVVSIKMTLYRLAKHSKVVEALVEAAENGKQVDVLVELKARFDEENNIEWSRTLEKAGCHVIYGLEGLKVHSKLCLITRRTTDGVGYITQIGTGNYNEKTSRLYTDLSIMTSNEAIGAEAANIFKKLSLNQVVKQTEHLMVAPKCLQNKVIERIEREIQAAKEGKEAYLGFKINSLTDKKIIDKLIEASQAGVKIEMVIRGICCLKAGIPGVTENISIISIVGRFLEHSRIYIFGKGEREEIYIASADFMTRNTVRRVEVAAPVYDEKSKGMIKDIFTLMLQDNCKARKQEPDGTYVRVPEGEKIINAQERLYEIAYEKAAGNGTAVKE